MTDGVPGLRLSVLASGYPEMVSRLNKDVLIWNINSFAEFYMQISEKYRKDYEKALEQFSAERKRFYDLLSGVDGLRVIPSQANFILAAITNGVTAEELTRRLIVNSNILIKTCVRR